MSAIELIFAYGSNMDIRQMTQRCLNSTLDPLVAKADGWKLCFPRHSPKRQGGVGSIIRASEAFVWGVVYRVTTHDLRSLDRYEGVFSNAYHRERLTVTSVDEKQIETWTFFAVPQDDPPKHYPPHRDYLALISGEPNTSTSTRAT